MLKVNYNCNFKPKYDIDYENYYTKKLSNLNKLSFVKSFFESYPQDTLEVLLLQLETCKKCVNMDVDSAAIFAIKNKLNFIEVLVTNENIDKELNTNKKSYSINTDIADSLDLDFMSNIYTQITKTEVIKYEKI